MKKYKHILRSGAAAVLLAACIAKADAQTTINITTTAVPFLRISPDARAGGMGDMGIATAPDANSGFHNLSKIPFAGQHSAIAVNYTPWMHDIVNGVYLASAGGYYQLDEEQAIGASLRYFNMGDFQVTDYNGNKLQTAHPREFAFDAGYARKLSNKLGIALALRYINSNLASGSVNGNNYKTGSAFAADISLYYHGLDAKGQGWSGGLVLSNLGSKISYTNDAGSKEFIPANAGLGVAYTAAIDEQNHLTLGAELNKLLVPAAPADSAGLAEYHARGVLESWTKSFSGGDYQLSAGAEYNYDNLFFARAAYHYADKAKGGWPYFSAGVGLSYRNASFDFSYLAASGNGTTRNPLSNTIRLGIAFGFGAKRAK